MVIVCFYWKMPFNQPAKQRILTNGLTQAK